MPVPEGVSKEKFDSCVAKVQAKGEVDNAYAVCTAALVRTPCLGVIKMRNFSA